MTNLFQTLKLNKSDSDEMIKQNMLKRFKEIHQDHEKEYSRLNVIILIQKINARIQSI